MCGGGGRCAGRCVGRLGLGGTAGGAGGGGKGVLLFGETRWLPQGCHSGLAVVAVLANVAGASRRACAVEAHAPGESLMAHLGATPLYALVLG
jgi:hypothetical protein